MSTSQLSRALRGMKVFTLDQLDAVCIAIGVDLVEVISDASEALGRQQVAPRGELIEGRFSVRGLREDLGEVAAHTQINHDEDHDDYDA